MSYNKKLLNKKTKKVHEISDDMNLSSRIERTKNMYNEFLRKRANNADSDNFQMMDEIIELNEIDQTYNYEFLKLQKQLKIKSKGGFSYEQNLKQLGPTLQNNNFYALTGNEQKNPAKEIYNLLNLYLTSPSLFDIETEKITSFMYNMPLIESVERVRMNYYLSLFQSYKKILNKKQIDFLSQNTLPKTDNEKKAKKVYNEYISLKDSIQKFSEVIKKMQNFFESINLDELNFNIKAYFFILNLTKIIDLVDEQTGKKTFIINLFQKEFDPSFENIISLEEGSNHIFKIDTIGILLVNKENNDYLIYNNYEKLLFNGKNYVIGNLIQDFSEHRITPIKYLLERNQTLDHFLKTNLNFINDQEIYTELMLYFKSFIKSKCMKEFLEKSEGYTNICQIINDDHLLEMLLNHKYLKSVPFFDFGAIGYTNKDIMIYLIKGTPFLIENYKIKNIEEYHNISNLIFFFNVGMKFIILLHEFLIHILFGYVYHLSEHEISSDSPKKDKIFGDGGLMFEELFFGKKIATITFQEIIALLNGEGLDSFSNFQEQFKKDFEEFKPKSQLVKKIVKKYPINPNLNDSFKAIGNMKSSANGIFMRRNLSAVLPSFTIANQI